jgi:hypothetical protein
MKHEYLKKAKYAAIVWGIFLIAGFLAKQVFVRREIVDVLIGINIMASIYGMAEFSRSKGYSGIIGTILGFFSFIGLIILFILPDRTAAPKPVKEGFARCYRCDAEVPSGLANCSNCGAEIV